MKMMILSLYHIKQEFVLSSPPVETVLFAGAPNKADSRCGFIAPVLVRRAPGIFYALATCGDFLNPGQKLANSL